MRCNRVSPREMATSIDSAEDEAKAVPAGGTTRIEYVPVSAIELNLYLTARVGHGAVDHGNLYHQQFDHHTSSTLS